MLDKSARRNNRHQTLKHQIGNIRKLIPQCISGEVMLST